MAALVIRTCSRRILHPAHRLLGVRYILHDSMLGLEFFVKKRQDMFCGLGHRKDAILELIQLKLENEGIISDHDLGPVIYLCETESDLQLAKKTLKRYCNSAMGVENKYGSMFLRMCYLLGHVDTAFEMSMDKSCREAFSGVVSYGILMDMLYRHGQYERAMEILLQNQSKGIELQGQAYDLIFAIIYKSNHPQSLEICKSLFKEAVTNSDKMPSLALCFIVALTLKQGDYEVAYSAYNLIVHKERTSLNSNFVLLLAAKFGYYDIALKILISVSKQSRFDFLKKHEFSREVMDDVEQEFKPSHSFNKFMNIYEQLLKSGHISNLTLEEMLQEACEDYDFAACFIEEEKLRK